MATPHLMFVRDAGGGLHGVLLSPELWERAASSLRAASDALEAESREVGEPLDDFRLFLEYWDFRYPYDPAVSCPHCGASAEDWRTESGHPFLLTTASLGGLLVFRCRRCRTTIRQKHFRDHVAFEHTTYSS